MLDPREPGLGRLDAEEGLAVEGSVALGHEGREGQRQADDLGQLEGEADQLVGVRVGLPRRPHHLVDLHPVETSGLDLLGGAEQVLLTDLAVEGQAHALADPVRSDGDRPVAAGREVAEQARGQAIGAEAGDADALAALDDAGDELLELRVIGDRGPDQADLLGVLGDQRERQLEIEDAHAPGRRPAHHTEGAAARAAALRLDQEHVAELGIRSDDRRAGRQQRRRAVGHRRDVLEVPRLDLAADGVGQLGDRLDRVAPAPTGGGDPLDGLGQQALGLADHQQVDEGQEHARVGIGQRSAGEDDRVAGPSVGGEDRDPGALEQADEPADLELVGDRDPDHRVAGDRLPGLVAEDRPLRLRPGQGHPLPIVGQEGPVAADPGVVEQPVEGLEAEARHPDPIGARVGEDDRGRTSEPERALLASESPLYQRRLARSILT